MQINQIRRVLDNGEMPFALGSWPVASDLPQRLSSHYNSYHRLRGEDVVRSPPENAGEPQIADDLDRLDHKVESERRKRARDTYSEYIKRIRKTFKAKPGDVKEGKTNIAKKGVKRKMADDENDKSPIIEARMFRRNLASRSLAKSNKESRNAMEELIELEDDDVPLADLADDAAKAVKSLTAKASKVRTNLDKDKVDTKTELVDDSPPAIAMQGDAFYHIIYMV